MDSHLSVRIIVFLLYEWSVSTPIQDAAYELNLSENTASAWYERFREISSRFTQSHQRCVVGDEGDTVEIDECQIGRRKYHRGRLPNEVWIFGGIVRNSAPLQIFLEIVENRRATTLLEIIRRKISLKTRIISDGWGSYSGLSDLGFNHCVVNHSEVFVSRENPDIHTQNIECLWRCLRRFLNNKGGYAMEHLQSYICEFIFRKTFVDTFDTMLSAIEEQFSRS